MKGIAMTARNVPKVMTGPKTQTRRVEAALRRLDDIFDTVERLTDEDGKFYFRFSYETGSVESSGTVGSGSYSFKMANAIAWEDVEPYYNVGDVLYVKEALCRMRERATDARCFAAYHADQIPVMRDCFPRPWESDDGSEWKNSVLPARFMPKSAARTFIKITDVRCERIQDISTFDISSEGCHVGETFETWKDFFAEQKKRFQQLWNGTNGPGSWESNPWVFAYTFELIKPFDPYRASRQMERMLPGADFDGGYP